METPPPRAFPHQAAKLSWVCPILVFLLHTFGGRIGARVLVDVVALLLLGLGFGFGIIALAGLRTHGPRGILGSAMGGLLINALLLIIFVTHYLAAKSPATQP